MGVFPAGHSVILITGYVSAVVRLESHLQLQWQGRKYSPKPSSSPNFSLGASRSHTNLFNSLGLEQQLEVRRGGHRCVSMTHAWSQVTRSLGISNLWPRKKLHRHDCRWCHSCPAYAHHLCFFLPACFFYSYSGEKLSCRKNGQSSLVHYQTQRKEFALWNSGWIFCTNTYFILIAAFHVIAM